MKRLFICFYCNLLNTSNFLQTNFRNQSNNRKNSDGSNGGNNSNSNDSIKKVENLAASIKANNYDISVKDIRVKVIINNKKYGDDNAVTPGSVEYPTNVEGPALHSDPKYTCTAGLNNIGQMCYVNSILQCFAHTFPFQQF